MKIFVFHPQRFQKSQWYVGSLHKLVQGLSGFQNYITFEQLFVIKNFSNYFSSRECFNRILILYEKQQNKSYTPIRHDEDFHFWYRSFKNLKGKFDSISLTWDHNNYTGILVIFQNCYNFRKTNCHRKLSKYFFLARMFHWNPNTLWKTTKEVM